MTFNATINNSVPRTCIINCGATSQFIDFDVALFLNLNLDLKLKLEDLIIVNGRRSSVGQIIYSYTLKLNIDQYSEVIIFQVTKLARWNLSDGKTWLRRYNPLIDWEKNTLTFASSYCQAYYLPT